MKAKFNIYLNEDIVQFDRYNSWSHCYNAFGISKDVDYLSLHLGFYLASWGMYRGSSKLLQHDYLVHVKAIEILNKYGNLRCNKTNEVSKLDIPQILNLIEELREYYKNHNITPTDTLISKILLGTLGCIPAFDRFFLAGVKNEDYKFKSLKYKSLKYLFNYSDNNKQLNELKIKYPIYTKMRLIDRYFWQIGLNISRNKGE